MSMLGSQADELREKADLLDGLEGMDNLVRMLSEAADTIISLRNRLQEAQGGVDHWRTEQVHAYGNREDAYKRVVELEANNGTRWHELFGTPERAAKTVSAMCSHGIWSCDGCPLFDEGVEHCESELGDTPSLLEWLRGDAE